MTWERASFDHYYFLRLTCAGAMDTFARGLRCASELLDDGVLPALVKERYSSFDSGIGAEIEKGTTNFEELEVHNHMNQTLVHTNNTCNMIKI